MLSDIKKWQGELLETRQDLEIQLKYAKRILEIGKEFPDCDFIKYATGKCVEFKKVVEKKLGYLNHNMSMLEALESLELKARERP